MYLYVIFWIIAISTFIFEIYPGKRFRLTPGGRKSLFGILLIFWIVSTFRWEIGTDWTPYLDHYDFTDGWNLLFYFEPGYEYLVALDKWIFPNYNFHLGIVMLLVLAFTVPTILRYSIAPFLSLLILYAVWIFIFPVRQNIAIAILCYSLKFVIERQFTKFLCYVLAASCFHVSSLIALFIYPLFYRRYSTRFILLCCMIGFIIGLGSSAINIISVIIERFFPDKAWYLSMADESFGSAYSPQVVFFRGVVNRSFLLMIIFSLLRKERERLPLLNGFVNMFIFSFLFFSITNSILPVLTRSMVIYDMSQIFIFPYIFSKRMSKDTRYILFGIIVIYLLYRFHGVIYSYENAYIPYKSIFSK